MVISLQDLQKIKADPMMDPRVPRDFVQRIDRVSCGVAVSAHWIRNNCEAADRIIVDWG
jgi:hypothetical protein